MREDMTKINRYHPLWTEPTVCYTQPLQGGLCAPFPHLSICIKVTDVACGVSFDLPLIRLRRYYQIHIRGEQEFV